MTSLGLLYRIRGEAADAVAYLERAAQVNPFDPRIHEALADLYDSLGREREHQRAVGELDILYGSYRARN